MSSAEGNITSLAGRATTIENTLPGKASQTSVDSLSSTVSALGGVVTAQGSSLTSLSALVGNNSSNAIFKIDNTATSSGATATGIFAQTVSDGTHTAQAGWKTDLVVQGGVAHSRLVAFGDEIVLLANSITADNLVAGAASQFYTPVISWSGDESWSLQSPTDTITVNSDTRRHMFGSPLAVPAGKSTAMVVVIGSFVATTGATTTATAGFTKANAGIPGSTDTTRWRRRFSAVDDVSSFCIATTIAGSGTVNPWVGSNGQAINAYGFEAIFFAQR